MYGRPHWRWWNHPHERTCRGKSKEKTHISYYLDQVDLAWMAAPFWVQTCSPWYHGTLLSTSHKDALHATTDVKVDRGLGQRIVQPHTHTHGFNLDAKAYFVGPICHHLVHLSCLSNMSLP